MTSPFSKAQFRQSRRNHMVAARECRDTLTSAQGFWQYAPNDERVKAAVAAWVARARHAHAIAMGRKPVIQKVVVINHGHAAAGPVYAE